MNRMIMLISCVFLVLMAGCATDGLPIVGISGSVKSGPNDVTITSPKGQVQTIVTVNDEGRLCYTIERIKPKRTIILEESSMGITIDDTDFGMGVKIGEPEQYSINEKYPWRGVHPVAVNNCIGAKIPITHTDSNTPYTLDVRVFDDGMGYRYVVPGEGERAVSAEASVWNLPDDCNMWYQTVLNNYEGVHKKENVMVKDPNIGFPVTVEYPDGTYAAITEAGLFAFSGMTLEADGTSTLNGVFLDDESWQETGEISTPWRVTITGPDLNALVNSDIVHNLCPPPDAELQHS